MKKILLGLTAALAMSVGTIANAGVLIEPYLGYHTGKLDIGGTTGEVTTKGVTYGARLGYQMMGFMGGIDYMAGTQSFDLPAGPITVSVDGKVNDLGLFVGYDFPVLVRAYFVYVPASKFEITYTGGDDSFKGKSMKLGVGFTPIPLLSINVEYISSTYDEDKNGAMTPEVTGKLYGVTVSVPFDI